MNLDIEHLNALSPAERDRYMELERLFRTKGWKIVQAAAQENFNTAFMIGANANSWADNRIAFGNRTAWQQILGFEEATEQLYEGRALEALKANLVEAIVSEHDYE